MFGPHKTYFNSNANAWMLLHPGKTVTIYQMAQLIGDAWLKAATPTNIISGFKLAGIWPLDRTVFQSHQYLPSSVTDREFPADVHTPGPVAADIQVVTSPVAHSTTSAVDAFLSPQQFKGYPKVTGYVCGIVESRICALHFIVLSLY